MKIKRVVVNASPLILLFKGGLADLLPELFAEIIVPGAVWDEIMAGGENDAAARALPTLSWAKRAEVTIINPTITAWNLGAVESDVLNLALTLPDCRVMLDDAVARAAARTLGIPLLGTGGALVLAKKHGLLTSVSDALRQLRDNVLWLSDDVETLLKKQAGE